MAPATPSLFGVQTILKAQYDGLGKFVEEHPGHEPTSSNGKKSILNLSGMSMSNLEELAADLYDEVARREEKTWYHIPVTDRLDYTAERNKARQRLATCQEKDLRFLARSLRHELERRYPEFKVASSGASIAPSVTDTIFAVGMPAVITSESEPEPERTSIPRNEEPPVTNLPGYNEIYPRSVQPAQITQFELFRTYIVGYQLGAADQDEERRARFTELLSDQFNDLTNDVYDELVRRQLTPELSSLPEEPSYPPKRNHARTKLSKLGDERLKRLVADIVYEMLRRFPSLRVPHPNSG